MRTLDKKAVFKFNLSNFDQPFEAICITIKMCKKCSASNTIVDKKEKGTLT
jgi:hypothetical protein